MHPVASFSEKLYGLRSHGKAKALVEAVKGLVKAETVQEGGGTWAIRVIILAGEAVAPVVPTEAAPPDLGVPAWWVVCEEQRAPVVCYVAGEGSSLPQAAKVKALWGAWAKAQGGEPLPMVVRPSLDGDEIQRLVRAWDARRGMVGPSVTLAYPLALPDVVGDDSAERAVRLAERLEDRGGVLLPWYNRRLLELHREGVRAAAPSWARPVWSTGVWGKGSPQCPRGSGAVGLETSGRVVSAQAARREALGALRAVWGPETERLRAAGEPYPVMPRAREAWTEDGQGPATGLLLHVAEHRRCRSRRWGGRTGAE